MRPGRCLAAALLSISLALVGCDRGGPEPPSPKVVTAVGLRLERTTLTGTEFTDAKAWAKAYAASLVSAHAELAGLTAQGIFAVFDETTTVPIGAMARLVLPAAVPSVELDLIRSKAEVPEKVPSQITQLRSLDAIYEFAGRHVLFLGISPQATDAADPATETVARPVDPEKHRDTDFGKDDE
ncbi:MAG: hypothetical protein QOE84_597 [Actinomycetota bacterium]|jgi:hypothetical protein|nr:hypothetical protein [Actinomycetota bacterium]